MPTWVWCCIYYCGTFVGLFSNSKYLYFIAWISSQLILDMWAGALSRFCGFLQHVDAWMLVFPSNAWTVNVLSLGGCAASGWFRCHWNASLAVWIQLLNLDSDKLVSVLSKRNTKCPLAPRELRETGESWHVALWEFNPAAVSVTSAASLLSFNAIVNVTAPL